MLELWRKRLNISSLGLRHEDPRVFVMSQWQTKQKANAFYMSYRILITVYLVIAWILSIIDEEHLNEPYPFHLKWFIYLTNWGFTFCTLQAVTCTTMLCNRYFKERNTGVVNDQEDQTTLWPYKFYWVCFTVSLDLGIAITLLYWIVIFDPHSMTVDYLNVMLHCTNSVVMLFELCVVNHPVRLLHFYLPVCSGAAYTLFSLFYYLAGGTSRLDEPTIYPVVDWRKPIPTLLVCLGACVLLVLIHCVTYAFFKIRVTIAEKLMKTEDSANIPVQETFKGFDNDCLANDTV